MHKSAPAQRGRDLGLHPAYLSYICLFLQHSWLTVAQLAVRRSKHTQERQHSILDSRTPGICPFGLLPGDLVLLSRAAQSVFLTLSL